MDFSILDGIIEMSKTFTSPYNKQSIVDSIVKKFKLSKSRKVYFNDKISIRFSSAKSGYSNTFLGFQKILDNDSKPLVACIIRVDSIEFLLANATFINCISHSSKNLSIDNIKGSANLSNIIREFSELKNEPKNFPKLFEMHSEILQKDNIERIVENTLQIKAKGERFAPDESQLEIIRKSPENIKEIEEETEFIELKEELIQKVIDLKEEILKTSSIDNVNIRGNTIEQLITEDENSHELGDIFEVINDNCSIIIDVKSKLLNYSSAPKAYNIDKLLEAISNDKTYFGYLFIGVDDKSNEVKVSLVSFLDKFLITNTKIQHHWSGKNSRGTAQLTDNIKNVFNEKFKNEIDIKESKAFVEKLIGL
ncbi:MAG: hypothetical protein GX612_02385 [Bacteroidales bacterium]|nr:hypothetical protein [Bacteroidales bacterium]